MMACMMEIVIDIIIMIEYDHDMIKSARARRTKMVCKRKRRPQRNPHIENTYKNCYKKELVPADP